MPEERIEAERVHYKESGGSYGPVFTVLCPKCGEIDVLESGEATCDCGYVWTVTLTAFGVKPE
jgi:hypothetical protein